MSCIGEKFQVSPDRVKGEDVVLLTGKVLEIRDRDGGVTPQRAGRTAGAHANATMEWESILTIEKLHAISIKAREEFKPRARPWEGKEKYS